MQITLDELQQLVSLVARPTLTIEPKDVGPDHEIWGDCMRRIARERDTLRAVHYDITTNGIESVFAVLKRGIIGVYHRVSVKHLGRYVHEFSFRLNDGNVARKTVDRLDSFIAGVTGKRLTYNSLIQ